MSDSSIVIDILGDDSDLKRKLSSIGKEAQSALSGAGKAISGVGATITASVTAPLIAATGAAAKWGMATASAAEQAEIAFTTMLGGADKAKEMLDSLAAFAAKTPFELAGLTEASQKLLAYGFKAKEVIPLLTAVGDATAGLGTGQQGIDSITRALGQMKAKGKVSAEEMLQLTEAGVPAWQMLADTISKGNVAGAMEKVKKGAVKADEAIAALQAGMNKKFGGMMEKQATTLTGILSNMGDAVEGVVRTIYKSDAWERLSAALAGLADNLAPFIEKLMPSAEALIDSVAHKVSTLSSFLESLSAENVQDIVNTIKLVAGMGPVLMVIGKALSTASNMVSPFIKGFSVAENSVRSLFSVASKMSQGLSQALKGPLAPFVNGMKEHVVGATQSVAQGFGNLKDVASSAFSNIKSGISSMAASLQNGALNAINAFKNNVNGIKDIAKSVGSFGLASAKGIGMGFLAAGAGVAALTATLGGAAIAAVMSGTSLTSLSDSIIGNIVSARDLVMGIVDGIRQAIPDVIVFLNESAGEIVDMFFGCAEDLVSNFASILPGLGAVFSAALPIVIRAIEWLLPQVTSLLLTLASGLMTGLAQAVDGLAQALPGIVQEIGAVLVTQGPMFLEACRTLFMSLINAITVVMGLMVEILPGLIQSVIDVLPGFAGTLFDAAISLLSTVLEAFPMVIPMIIGAVINLLTMIVTTFPQWAPKFIMGAMELIKSLAIGVIKAAVFVINAFVDLCKQAIDTIAHTDWIKVGMDIINGLVNGIKEMGGKVLDCLTEIAKSAIDGVMSIFGIHSPSRVFRQIGIYTGEGLALGITDSEASVMRAMSNLAHDVIDEGSKISNALPDMNSKLQHSINATAQVSANGVFANLGNRIDAMSDRLEKAMAMPIDINYNGREFGRMVREVGLAR